MTRTTRNRTSSTAIAPTLATSPPVTRAARNFFDCLARQDFDGLAATFSDDVHLHALLPGGFKEWQGAERVKATFIRWFGNTQDFDLIEADVGDIDSRLQMRWRA